ncbi:MAG: hypothetical protein V5A29_06860 [Haloarculaceae archaeon]
MPALESLTDQLSRSAVETVPALQPTLETLAALLVLPVQFVSFWVAALLPLTYLPLLATGVVAEHPTTFLAVLCANAVTFVLGHGHRRPDAA